MFLLPHGIRQLIEKLQDKKPRQFRDSSVAVTIAPWDMLSFREQEVVVLMYEMYSNEKMAEILGVTHATIKSHLDHIFKKLDVHSKREVRWLLGEWPFREWWASTHHK